MPSGGFCYSPCNARHPGGKKASARIVVRFATGASPRLVCVFFDYFYGPCQFAPHRPMICTYAVAPSVRSPVALPARVEEMANQTCRRSPHSSLFYFLFLFILFIFPHFSCEGGPMMVYIWPGNSTISCRFIYDVRDPSLMPHGSSHRVVHRR